MDMCPPGPWTMIYRSTRRTGLFPPPRYAFHGLQKPGKLISFYTEVAISPQTSFYWGSQHAFKLKRDHSQDKKEKRFSTARGNNGSSCFIAGGQGYQSKETLNFLTIRRFQGAEMSVPPPPPVLAVLTWGSRSQWLIGSNTTHAIMRTSTILFVKCWKRVTVLVDGARCASLEGVRENRQLQQVRLVCYSLKAAGSQTDSDHEPTPLKGVQNGATCS